MMEKNSEKVEQACIRELRVEVAIQIYQGELQTTLTRKGSQVVNPAQISNRDSGQEWAKFGQRTL